MDVSLLVLVTSALLRDGLALATDYFFSSTKLNWNQANDYCDAHNGRLILLNSQDKWDEYEDAMESLNKCSIFHWTALILDSYDCETRSFNRGYSYNGWSYSGWGIWNGMMEPNDCPNDKCVVVTCNGMNTRGCGKTYKALCKKVTSDITTTKQTAVTTSDDRTTTQTTQLVDVTSEVRTTTPTTQTAEVTSKIRTTTHTTRTAGATAEISTNTPRDTTVAPTANHTIKQDANLDAGLIDSCNDCCVMNNNSRQLNNEELKSSIKKLKLQLAVNKTNLSASRRKLISVYDSRSSSVTMGAVAIAKLTVVFGLIVIPDVVSLVRFLFNWL